MRLSQWICSYVPTHARSSELDQSVPAGRECNMYARSRTTVQQVRDFLQDLCREVLAYCTHDLKRLRIWWCTVVFRSKCLPIFYAVPTCQRHELRPIMMAAHE